MASVKKEESEPCGYGGERSAGHAGMTANHDNADGRSSLEVKEEHEIGDGDGIGPEDSISMSSVESLSGLFARTRLGTSDVDEGGLVNAEAIDSRVGLEVAERVGPEESDLQNLPPLWEKFWAMEEMKNLLVEKMVAEPAANGTDGPVGGPKRFNADLGHNLLVNYGQYLLLDLARYMTSLKIPVGYYLAVFTEVAIFVPDLDGLSKEEKDDLKKVDVVVFAPPPGQFIPEAKHAVLLWETKPVKAGLQDAQVLLSTRIADNQIRMRMEVAARNGVTQLILVSVIGSCLRLYYWQAGSGSGSATQAGSDMGASVTVDTVRPHNRPKVPIKFRHALPHLCATNWRRLDTASARRLLQQAFIDADRIAQGLGPEFPEIYGPAGDGHSQLPLATNPDSSATGSGSGETEKSSEDEDATAFKPSAHLKQTLDMPPNQRARRSQSKEVEKKEG